MPKAPHFDGLFVWFLAPYPLQVADGECNTQAAFSEQRAHILHGELVVKPRVKSSASALAVRLLRALAAIGSTPILSRKRRSTTSKNVSK
jgi:hypothetical protein